MINKDSYYKVTHNNDVFIVEGNEVEKILEIVNRLKRVVIEDISGSYYNAPYNEDSELSFKELYRIKYIELR